VRPYHIENHQRLLNKLAIIFASAILPHAGFPLSSIASEGAAPKMEFFGSSDSSPIGESIYDEAEIEVIKERVKTIEQRWNTLVDKVQVALKKGRKADVQTLLANAMTSLKADMRRVSKVACGGDILVRQRVGAEANFDYNTGQFEYKPIAKKAEDLIAEVNELYFYAIKDKGEGVAERQLDTAKRYFDEWNTLVKKNLPK
jgi:hypothetical protein